MLILSRRLGESILFDDDIIVTILDQQGGQTRLGITAPHEVNIVRDELVNADFHEDIEHDRSRVVV